MSDVLTPPDYDPRFPHPHPPYELMARGVALERLTKKDAHRRAGFGGSEKTRGSRACVLLGRLSNGIQARIQALMDEVAASCVVEASAHEKRRLRTQDQRQDEVHTKFDQVWGYATTLVPKMTPQGLPMKTKIDGIEKPIHSYRSEKLVGQLLTALSIEAGMNVRQSRSGKMEEPWEGMGDAQVQEAADAMLKEFGLVTTRVTPGTEPEDPIETEPGAERGAGSLHAVR